MFKIEKVMLAVPNNRWFGHRHWHNFPHTLGILTSVLKSHGYDTKILDAGYENLSPEQVKSRVEQYQPDVFGISCLSMEYSRHFQKLAAVAKEVSPDIRVVVGGVYPTLLPEALMQNPDIDFSVLGEGEYRFPKLLQQLKKDKPDFTGMDGVAFRTKDNKVQVQKVENFIQNLDEVPLPDYDGIDIAGYMNTANKYAYYVNPRRFPYAQTMTSRGCPFDCIFCSSKATNGPTIRYRSAESVLKEIDWLVDKYGIKEIIFADDNFYLDKKRAEKIMDGMIERKHDLEWKVINAAVYALNDNLLEKTRASGCYQLPLAIESGTQEGLDRLRKPLKLERVAPVVKKARSLGMEVTGMFVIGTPGETWDQIRRTFAFAEGLDLDMASFHVATPLPRTQLYEMVKRDKQIPEDFDFNSLDFKGFAKATITTPEFVPEELQIVRAYEWDRINFKTPEKIARIARMHGITLEEVEDWRKSTRRGLGVNVKYKE